MSAECKIALSMLKGITAESVRRLADCGLSADDFFTLSHQELAAAIHVRPDALPDRMALDEALVRARKEMAFMAAHHVKALYLLDDDYPLNLREVADAPVVLYQVGNANLNAERSINMVGTRMPTSYGVDFCERTIKELGEYFPGLLVVSGLAYGIDSTAHKAALRYGLPTVAVVAHGLHTIYPSPNRELAARIVKSGGAVVSEYPSGTKSYRQNFLARNRIIAGLTQATFVVESDVRGGAMSTANMAFSYSREVFALPGRAGDKMSSGCNLLIRKQKASLATSAADVMEALNWRVANLPVNPQQRNLFPELEGDCAAIYDALRFNNAPMSIDAIYGQTMIPMAKIMAALGELEADGIVLKHPGNRFSL